MRTSAWFACIAVSLITRIAPLAYGQNAPVALTVGKTAARLAGKTALDPSIKASALWDGRQSLDFRGLDDPKMVVASRAGFLEEDEHVLGLTVNGESRAYPVRYLAWHHVVNDKVGKPELGGKVCVAITYCVVCNSGIRFDPVVQGRPLKFDFYGLYNGVVTLYDKETQSVWFQVGGRAVKGPLLGTTLKTGPLLDTTWSRWKALHPDTLVMRPEPRFRRFYDSKGTDERYLSFPGPYFRPTLTHRDHRLPDFTMVLAVVLPPPASTTSVAAALPEAPTALYRAYPIKTLQASSGVINDTLGTLPVGVLFEKRTETAVAVSRILDGRTLTFETRKLGKGQVAIYDQETGTRWNIEGMAEAGPLAGRTLTRLDGHLSEWYGWSAYFPQTTIFHPEAAAQREALRLHLQKAIDANKPRTASR